MAFGEVIPIQYSPTIQTTDVAQLAGNVQTALQGRFDVNSAKIEEMIQNVSSVPLLREKDKQYLGEKLNGLLNTVNANLKSSGGRGLLSNSTTAEVNRYITTAIDDNVKQQLANSQNIINFEKGVVGLKGKKDGGYNDANYAYSKYKAGYDNYMSGEVDTLGSLEYSPYVDYQQTTMEKALKLKQLKGDQEIEVPDGRGGKTVTKISGLTAQEVIQYFPGMVSSEEEKQMAIDGWNAFRGAPPQVISQQATDFFNSRKNAIVEEIKSIEAMETVGTQAQIQEAKRRKKMYQDDLQTLIERENQIDKTNPEQVGYLLNKEQFKQTASQLFSGRTSVSYEKDETFFAKAKLEIDLEELELNKLKTGLELKEKYGIGADGKPVEAQYADSIAVSSVPLQEVPEADYYSATKESFNTAYNTVINTAELAYNDQRTSDEHKTLFNTHLKANGYEVKDGKIVSTVANNKVSKAAASELAFRESGMASLPFGYDKQITQAGLARQFLSQKIGEAEKEIGKEFNTDEFLSDFIGAKETVSGGNLLQRTFRAFDVTSPNELGANQIIGEGSEERFAVAKEMQDFVNRNGGEASLKVKMKQNPSLLNEMKRLLDKASEVDSQVSSFDYANPLEATGKAGKKLKELGVEPFVKSQWKATLGSEGMRQNLINMMPQDELLETFDAKLPITAVKISNDEIRVVQSKGVNAKGEGKVQAEHIFKRGDSGFELLSKNISLESKFDISVASTPSNFTIKPDNKPKFYAQTEGNFVEDLITQYQYNINDQVKAELQAQAGGVNLAEVFSTKEGSRAYFQTILKDKVSTEQIDEMINRINNNFENYQISIKNNNKMSWLVQFSTPNGLDVKGNLNNKAELDGDYAYMLKNMPQLLIMLEVAKHLRRNPQDIDKI